MDKMSKSKMIFGLVRLILIAVVILTAVGFGAYYTVGYFSQYSKSMRKGDEAMSLNRYEDAKMYYIHAMNQNVKKTDAYCKLADYALAICDNGEKAEKVFEILNEYTTTESGSAVAGAYLKCAKKLYADGDSINAARLLDKGYVSTYDISLSKQNKKYLDKAKNDYIDQLRDAITSGDNDKIRTVMTSGNFSWILPYTKDNAIIFGEGDGAIGVYNDGSVYYGHMEDSVRTGDGVLYLENDEMSYTYSGQWSQDKPNGSGVVAYVLRRSETLAHSEITGNFKDGKFDGEFVQRNVMTDGKNYTYKYTVNYGTPVAIGEQGGSDMLSRSEEDKNRVILYAKSDTLTVSGFADTKK